MKTYIAFKNEIEGLNNVFETVNAEEKIAASAVQSLKKEIISLNLFSEEVKKLLQYISLHYQPHSHPLMNKDSKGGRALLILTGDKGLVSGLWHQVINESLKIIKSYQHVIVYGIRGKKYLEEENVHISKFFTSNYPNEEDVDTLCEYFFNQFKKGAFSGVDILYPQFVSISKHRPQIIQFLPFEFHIGQTQAVESHGFPIFEPSKKKVFNMLLDKYIKIFFYKIFSETNLSKFSARTISMENARAKTKETIVKSIHSFNKQRHRLLTQRQLVSFGSHKNIK